jgi:hypothetical protein
MDQTIAALALLVVVSTVAATTMAFVPRWLERRSWRKLEARRVVVNLKSGPAVDGILVERTSGYLRIREAVLHSGGSDEPAPLDGEVVVLNGEVEYLQYPST